MPLINCLVQNDEAELLMVESEMTLVKAMDSVSLIKLENMLGRRNIIKAITALLMRLSDNFNMKGKFNTSQSAILAVDLFDIFGHETLEDVMLMFKYVRQGRIGDGKDFKLDGQTVFHKWVPEYLSLKSEQRELQYMKTKGEKNGMSNFKWQKGQSEKIETSEKEVTFREGLGTRMAKAYATQNQSINPDVLKKREVMIEAMKTVIPKQSLISLMSYIKVWKDDPNRDNEVLKIVESEIHSRHKI